jgi:type II secretory pathway pseudopilin PulG
LFRRYSMILRLTIHLNYMRNIRTNKRGFTIVEMLVYCGILMIFLYIMTSLFSSVIDVQLYSEATAAVAQDSRYLLSRFSYDINRASEIVVPADVGTESDTLQLTIDGNTYTYEIQNGNLELTDETGTDMLNSFGTSVSNVNFRRLGSVGGKNSIRLAFTLTSKTKKVTGPEIRNFQTTVGLR